MLGVLPFGVIFGVLALAAGLPPALAQAMSVVVFAGSAQFIGVQLIAGGAGTAVLWLTTFIVNLRHLLYGASLAGHLRHLPQRWRWLLAYLLTDEAYVVTVLHYQQSHPLDRFRHWFFLGAGVTLWAGWQLSTAAGVFLGTQVPPEWSLDFSLALTFIGLVMPSLRQRPHLGTAVIAAVVAVLTFTWPYKLGLVAAALAGIIAGVWLEARR